MGFDAAMIVGQGRGWFAILAFALQAAILVETFAVAAHAARARRYAGHQKRENRDDGC